MVRGSGMSRAAEEGEWAERMAHLMTVVAAVAEDEPRATPRRTLGGRTALRTASLCVAITYMCICICVYTYVYACICVYICMYMYMMYRYVCIYTYVLTI